MKLTVDHFTVQSIGIHNQAWILLLLVITKDRDRLSLHGIHKPSVKPLRDLLPNNRLNFCPLVRFLVSCPENLGLCVINGSHKYILCPLVCFLVSYLEDLGLCVINGSHEYILCPLRYLLLISTC